MRRSGLRRPGGIGDGFSPQIPQMDADAERESRPCAGVTRRVIGAFYEVYNELGFGFLESVYQEAMAIALADAGMRCEREPLVSVVFRGRSVGEFRPDLVVDSAVVVELKVVRTLAAAHNVQVINYLRATRFEVGLLLNFGPTAQVRRFVVSNARKRVPHHLRPSA